MLIAVSRLEKSVKRLCYTAGVKWTSPLWAMKTGNGGENADWLQVAVTVAAGLGEAQGKSADKTWTGDYVKSDTSSS